MTDDVSKMIIERQDYRAMTKRAILLCVRLGACVDDLRAEYKDKYGVDPLFDPYTDGDGKHNTADPETDRI